jgi:FkbM family methyltransferase
VRVNLLSRAKRLIPHNVLQRVRLVEDWGRRLRLGFTNPVILEDDFGVKFILYPHDTNPIRWQLQAGTNREELFEIQKRVKKGDTVFDVGANVGLVTIPASKIVGEGGRVYSFEPHPKTFEELTRMIALNSCKNIHTENVAVSSSEGTQDFYYVENHKLNSLGPIEDKTYGENKVMRVPTITIDGYCNSHNISRIDFLKIDVEGFEYDVLKGASQMLTKKAIGCIQFEMHHEDRKIIDLLKNHDYQLEEHPKGFNWYASPSGLSHHK